MLDTWTGSTNHAVTFFSVATVLNPSPKQTDTLVTTLLCDWPATLLIMQELRLVRCFQLGVNRFDQVLLQQYNGYTDVKK